MLAMHPIIALLLAGSAVSPPTISQATTVAIARARILGPAEVRRVGDRLEITTGERTAPTQVHQAKRRDGGETADFYRPSIPVRIERSRDAPRPCAIPMGVSDRKSTRLNSSH